MNNNNSVVVPSIATLQALLDAVPSPVFVVGQDHRLVFVNASMCEFAGCSREELIGTCGSKQLSQEQLDVFWQADDLVFKTELPNENEEVATDGTGALRVISTRKRLIRLQTEHGIRPFVIGVIADVTRFREAEARAKYLAEHDALTGLANRIHLTDYLLKTLEGARLNKKKASILVLDLDGFKPVNDQFGHPIGDEVLRIVGKRLARIVRNVDLVARLGGDEFAIVQDDLDDIRDAESLAERIIKEISLPIVVGPVVVSVSVSVGIAIYPDDGTTSDVLIERADKALYLAKKKGGRDLFRYHKIWTGESAPLIRDSWNIESDLRRAFGTKQIFLVFQPFADAVGRRISGFEAQVRWTHPDHGDISPDVFIPAAESIGLIGQLNDWALSEACMAAAKWPEPLRLTVNISSTQLECSDLADAVATALRKSNLSSSRLELEISDKPLPGDATKILENLHKLRELKVSLALDDFGASWLSQTCLGAFRFDRIKIGRSVVQNIETSPHSLMIVRAVLGLAKGLDIPVTANGVENEAEALALETIGCSELQGNFFSFQGPSVFEPSLES